MEGVWSYLRRKPLQRRVTVMLTVAVALAILLSNARRLRRAPRHPRAGLPVRSPCPSPRTSSRPRPPASRTPGSWTRTCVRPAGVVVEAVNPSGAVVRVPGRGVELVLRARRPRLGRAGRSDHAPRRASTPAATRTSSSRRRSARPATRWSSPARCGRSSGSSTPSGSSCSASSWPASWPPPWRRPSSPGRRCRRCASSPPPSSTSPTPRTSSRSRSATPPATWPTLAGAFNQLLRSISRMRERQSRLDRRRRARAADAADQPDDQRRAAQLPTSARTTSPRPRRARSSPTCGPSSPS